MTKALQKQTGRTAIQSLAGRLQVSEGTLQTTLKKTAFSACKTNEEFIGAVIVANTYKLNPILGEIYAFPKKGGGVTPIVPIDGWISMSNRQPNFNGVELIENRTEGGETNNSGTDIESVTAKFYLKDKEHPVVVTEYMEECFDGSKEPWKRWPRRMLRHKAYIQGARIAFGFSGIYDADEADRINHVVGGTHTDIVDDEPEMPKEIDVDKGVETPVGTPEQDPEANPEEDVREDATDTLI